MSGPDGRQKALTVGNGVCEGHHHDCEECWDGIPRVIPGDAGCIHHHEGPHHQQGRPHRVGGDAGCMHTRTYFSHKMVNHRVG